MNNHTWVSTYHDNAPVDVDGGDSKGSVFRADCALWGSSPFSGLCHTDTETSYGQGLRHSVEHSPQRQLRTWCVSAWIPERSVIKAGVRRETRPCDKISQRRLL